MSAKKSSAKSAMKLAVPTMVVLALGALDILGVTFTDSYQQFYSSRGAAIVASLIGTAVFAGAAEYAYRAGYTTVSWVIALLPFILALIVILMFGVFATSVPSAGGRLAAGCAK